MFRTRRIHRIGSVVVSAAAVILVAGASRADKPKATPACNAAGVHVHAAHAAEAAGHIPEAIEAYRACTQETGCGWLAQKCDAKIKLLQSKLPTIVLVANDENGQPVADVEVRVDGNLLTSKLTGVGLPIQPGLHELSFSNGNGVFATEKVMVVDGQHDRLVTVTMHPQGRKAVAKVSSAVGDESAAASTKPAPEPAAAVKSESAQQSASSSDGTPTESKAAPAQATSETVSAGPSHWALPHSVLPYTLAAVGLVIVAGGALTTVWGNKDNTALENKCSPTCNPSSQTHIKTLYYISDAAYGVGLASLGVATWMFASSRSAEKASSTTATVVDVQPMPSGAFASVSGRF
jgi:hypothetical protein